MLQTAGHNSYSVRRGTEQRQSAYNEADILCKYELLSMHGLVARCWK